MAGVCAALAAARSGVSVALVQDRPVLGGNASSEIRMHICGADSYYDGESKPRLRARETGIIEELRLKSLAGNPEHNSSLMDLALYDTVRSQQGLRLFLNAQVVDCTICDEGGHKHVVSCIARELSSERVLEFRAKQFIDASGDGTLAYLSGAEYTAGREASSEFGESLAPDTADDATLGHTILFNAVNTGHPVEFTPPPWALKFSDSDLTSYRIPNRSFGFWWVEWGGCMDTVRDTEQIKDELIAAALGIWGYMKNSAHLPVNGTDETLENYTLNWFGFLPGKRESRRFIGDYILTESDVLSRPEPVRFADQIAYGGWPIDTHPPLGFRSSEPPCDQIRLSRIYQIPLRCCYCRDFDNLYLAGRNISATHVAFASTRVMATCAAIGEGVGVAAAISVLQSAAPQQVVQAYMPQLQQQLLENGVYLDGITSDQPHDVAKQAVISASSTLSDGDWAAENVTDGINHPDPVLNGCYHAWRSAVMPAHLLLEWAHPVNIGSVLVVCDTDFDSQLMLTQDSCHQRDIGSVPRPLTLKHMVIEVQQHGSHEWQEVAQVENNYQRMVRFNFPCVTITALRLRCVENWGAPYASILEIRCCGERS